MKKCHTCKQIKINNKFWLYKSGKSKGYLHPHCNLCEKKRLKLYRQSVRYKKWRKLYSLSGKQVKALSRYQSSPKGKKSRKRYLRSLKGRKYLKLWQNSTKCKKYAKQYKKIWRHSPRGKFIIKTHDWNYRLKTKDLTFKIIQGVYENNIKKYNILTCYLCLKPIIFKDDHLDHKIPISRIKEFPKTKLNSKKNLGVSCSTCNLSKGSMTTAEFRVKQKKDLLC